MTKLNDLIQSARQIVFMTGAGVSTASGIPDYRSKTVCMRMDKRRNTY